MTDNVITVGASKYGVGLFWQPSPDANVRAAARRAAKQPGYQSDLYVVRPATRARPVSQYGLGHSSFGHKAGMAAAAGCLANAMPGSYAGAFRIPEGVWFVVVRDDLVDADGDILFTNEQEAQLRLEQEMARGGLTKIYAPAEWSVEVAEDASLTSLLVGRKDVVFEDVKGPYKLILLILAVLAVGGLAYGGYSYYQEMERQRQEELARQEAERQRLAEQLAAKQHTTVATIEYPKTWQEQPLPRQWLLACETAMGKIPAQVAGWKLSTLNCAGKNLTVAWMRNTGLAVLPPEGSTWDAVLKAATLTIPLEGITARGEEALRTRRQMDEAILANSSPIDVAELPDDVAPTPPPAASGNQPPPPPPPPPPWQKRSFKFSVKFAPWLLNDMVDFPGLVMNSLSQSGTVWSVDATLYEQRNQKPVATIIPTNNTATGKNATGATAAPPAVGNAISPMQAAPNTTDAASNSINTAPGSNASPTTDTANPAVAPNRQYDFPCRSSRRNHIFFRSNQCALVIFLIMLSAAWPYFWQVRRLP